MRMRDPRKEEFKDCSKDKCKDEFPRMSIKGLYG